MSHTAATRTANELDLPFPPQVNIRAKVTYLDVDFLRWVIAPEGVVTATNCAITVGYLRRRGCLNLNVSAVTAKLQRSISVDEYSRHTRCVVVEAKPQLKSDRRDWAGYALGE